MQIVLAMFLLASAPATDRAPAQGTAVTRPGAGSPRDPLAWARMTLAAGRQLNAELAGEAKTRSLPEELLASLRGR